jgi:hypothetical protein
MKTQFQKYFSRKLPGLLAAVPLTGASMQAVGAQCEYSNDITIGVAYEL